MSIPLLLLSYFNTCAQPDSLLLRQKRLKPLLMASAGAYSASLVGLNQLWYDDFEKESFHFFNDNDEWLQMDKLGHFYSAYHISAGSYAGLRWAGVRHERSILWGSLASFIVLTPIEIFDGFSSGYGASYGDLIANTTGALLFAGQQILWDEIRLHPKFSFHRSGLAPMRPELLGSNLTEEILKDYNGQTFWISIDLSKFIKGKQFPRWLNFAIGYGACGMLYADWHPNIEAGFHPTRQYYLALDLDLNEYRSQSGFINTLIYIVNMVHIPAPALRFSDNELKVKFH